MNSALYHASYKLVSSLTKIMLRKGIAFSEFIQVVKQAYVDTCEQHLLETEGKATTSRIAIATGLTRKDVAKIRKSPLTPETISLKYNRSIRVISGWLEDKEFCTPGGYPEVLPINGIEKSFSVLVERYSGNMTTRAMLDELESVGIIKRIEKEHVSLQHHAYIPSGDEDEALTIMGTDVALLISTINHNMTSQPEEVYYQRKVCYNNLPEECIKELQALVKAESQILLEKYNSWLVQHDRDTNPEIKGTGRKQAGVGIYYFEEDVREEASQD
jgi:hypothetical protein